LIKKALTTAIFFFSFFVNAQSVDIRDITDKKILDQIEQDPTLIPMEKGALFVPALMDPDLEPHYTIFQNDEYVMDAKPGRRIPLSPGDYYIYVGSGPLDIQMKIDVHIENERVSVVPPVWSALIIKTIDQNNNDIKESYSIVDEKDKVQIGAGTGADILKGENDQIWILKPALYRISKRGESPYSFQNFVTVRTVSGDLSTVQMIFEEKTRVVMGGGEVIGDNEDRKYTGNWSFKGSVSANFSMVNTGYVKGGTGSINNFTLGSSINVSIVYDKKNLLFINRLEINEQFQKPDGEKLNFVKDLMKFDSSFIYRINQYVGPYVSVRVRTPFFYKYFKAGENAITVRELDGSEKTLDPGDIFTYSKSFSTTILQEGTGLNADYSYGNIFKINGRVGWGVRQDFNPFSYDVSELEDSNLITRVPYFNNMTGPEFYLYMSLFPLSFLEIKEEFDSLLPVDNVEKFSFTSKSSAFLWISRFAAIQYEFLVEKSPSTNSTDTITSEHSLTVQVYYNFP